MKITTNFHTHTIRCLHAIGTDEEYILEAIKNGYTTLGFSDHAPYPDNRHQYRMDYSELNDYYESILKLKDKYRDQIEILIGLEIEYDESCHDYYKVLLERFDYLLLGQHVTPHKGEYINNFELEDTRDYVLYAKYIEKALQTGFFKMLAHPDLVFLNRLNFDNNCKEAIDIIVRACAKHNTIVEINANGIRKGMSLFEDTLRYAYPTPNFFKIASKANLPVIIGADAHDPLELSGESIELAYNFAKEFNLNLVSDFRE